ncbi:RNA-directed DNA polymerase [Pseudoalteromonas sp. C12FD-1]|uniref:RNA-directed DNA polymerase n=1 Tax=Pseudoalteromonas sp. C12FD-1 TaxID=3131979 RepID=UPI00307E2A6B
MPVIDKKYEEISLADEYLGDPLLMALAWKKSHQYIRTTNWYADNFELDLSALNLVDHCDQWVTSLAQPIEFSKLELVPAPKTYQWEFVEAEIFDAIGEPETPKDHNLIWQPKPDHKKNNSESPLNIRPLAHIPIREQSMMTLLMMGLANKVETAQGNPEVPFSDVHEKGVVSYGNRLYCQYRDDGQANHSYGATTIYSKYFVDYRRFLERPYYFATQQLGEISPDERVYLIELDLSKFFDLIKREWLIKKINKLSGRQDLDGDYKCLDHLLAAFEQWAWTKNAANAYEELCKSNEVPSAPKGLPQGLVAAGFLSNVYMLDFDDQFQEYIGKCFSNSNLRLVDYCRYVDDIRLVVVGPKSFDNKNRISVVTEAVNILVENLDCWEQLNLKLNSEKTKVEIFHGRKVGLSKNLEEIQSRLSGPISFDEAENQLGQLESLLSLSNKVLVKSKENGFPVNLLANIENQRFDVREDTLKRFAANKLVKVLNEMRHFTTQEPDENGQLQPGDWDYLQERIARRFIACWSYDPALVLLLKKGLELFPSTKLLEPVLQQLEALMLRENEPKQQAVARYCLSEVFRHAATVIHKKDSLAIPAHANVDEFFELLQHSAANYA